MQNSFNRLIDSYIDEKVGIAEHFLSEALAGHLKNNLQALYAQKQLVSAGVGNGTRLVQDWNFRRDKIHWLDKKHNDPFENQFFELLDQFVRHLNATCYTGITDYEFHYTLYEPGAVYKKHIDQFRNDSSRQYSMIIYLNEDWQEKDGGALCIYHGGHSSAIYPNNCKAVLFKSNQPTLASKAMVYHYSRMNPTMRP